MIKTQDAGKRVNKRAFIRAVAERAGLQLKDAEAFYGAFLSILLEYVRDGVQVNLTGFGRYYRQLHLGHPVRFGAKTTPDYTVLRFSSTRKVNQFLDLDSDRAALTRVPGTSRTIDE